MNINERRGKAKQLDKKDRFEIPNAEHVDYVYATGNSKARVELKVFNPELHGENIVLKKKY